MTSVYKGQSKNRASVTVENKVNEIRSLIYSLSNPGPGPVTVNVYITGVLITPYNLVIQPGGLVKDDDYFLEVDDVLEIKTTGNVHYYIALK